MVVRFCCSVKTTGRESDREVSSAAQSAQVMSAKWKNGYPVKDFSNPLRSPAYNETAQ